MTIKYAFTPDGGFVCGDTETGATSYSFPGSPNVIDAKRDPEAVARGEMDAENAGPRGSKNLVDEYDRLNWERLGGRHPEIETIKRIGDALGVDE